MRARRTHLERNGACGARASDAPRMARASDAPRTARATHLGRRAYNAYRIVRVPVLLPYVLYCSYEFAYGIVHTTYARTGIRRARVGCPYVHTSYEQYRTRIRMNNTVHTEAIPVRVQYDMHCTRVARGASRALFGERPTRAPFGVRPTRARRTHRSVRGASDARASSRDRHSHGDVNSCVSL